jgi:uncharacterized protein (DUF302 family)
LNVEFRPYQILGACNPPFAYQALQAEDKIGTMLPCNIIVQQLSDEECEIAAINPLESMKAIGNPKLREVAEQVQAKLKSVIDSI